MSKLTESESIVVIRIYCGQWRTPEAEEKYHRVIAEWLTSGQSPVSEKSKKPPVTVAVLVTAFLDWAESHYIKNGRLTKSYSGYFDATRVLCELYGSLPVDEFDICALETVRDTMIYSRLQQGGGDVRGKKLPDKPLARKTVNARVKNICRIFKWGVQKKMVNAEIWHELLAVELLEKGRTKAKEYPKVKRVPEEWVEKTCEFLPSPVAAMVRLQLLTAMRSGEVTSLRLCDIDMTEEIWVYTPWEHKTEHHEDAENDTCFGFKSQAILTPYLMDHEHEPEAWLFSPREAVIERKTKLRENRKSPVQPSQIDRSKPNPKRMPGNQYTRFTYAANIRRAAKKAGVPHWFPNQLRHTALTAIRAKEGIEAAQIVANHKNVKTTEIYAERDSARADELALKYG